jgi:glutathione synthase/RimK-type ligase-like ATP-grasp enzyme
MILIATNKEDITADLVVLRFREHNVRYARFNTEDFPHQVGLTWRIRQQVSDVRLRLPMAHIDLADVSAIWFRRPVSPKIAPAVADPAAREFAQRESAAALRNLWAHFGGFWVSHPTRIAAAEQKLVQLAEAARHGLDTPETMLTSCPSDARAFIEAHREIVAKPLKRGYIEHDGHASVIYTTLLTDEDRARLDQVQFAPTLFQERVPRGFDLRVTVVGRTVFATEIRSGLAPEVEVDWRRLDPAVLQHTPHTLPPQIEASVLGLLRSFGLQFGALDFIVRPDGRYVFLEVNPNGQWAWIEQLIGTPISSAIADLLMGRAERL